MSSTGSWSHIDPSVLHSLLVDQVRNGVIVTDLSGVVLFWNRYATELYGWTAEEATGSDIFDLTVGPTGADLASKIMKEVTSGGTWSGEFEVARKDGSTFFAHVSNSMLRGADGEPVGVVGVSVDVTPIREAEAEAHRQGELARAVLDALPTAAVVLDRSGSVLAANRAWLEFAGDDGSVDAELGTRSGLVWTAQLDPDVRAGVDAAINRIGEEGGSWSIEYPSTSNGRQRWFVCDVTGLPVGGSVLMVREITDTVEERNMLMRLADDKDRFVTMVSHEVRTPMTAVLGLSEELAMSSDLSASQIAEFHQIIAEQAREVSSLVEDLLVVARHDNGTLSVVSEPVDVAAVVSSVLRPFHVTNGPVEISAADRPMMALADGARLRQVVRNLVSNAVRHGAPPLGVDIDSVDGVVRVTVSDHGPGIPPQHVEEVFRPGRLGVSGNPDSVGIGLSVARRLVERMDGTLEYQRSDRTQFIITLPAAPAGLRS